MKRLPKKFYELLKVVDKCIKQRSENLVDIEEYSIAILLEWNKIEAVLKLLKFYDNIEFIPNELNFINKKWKILKNLYLLDIEKYDLILNKEKIKSLWEIRNKIVHLNFEISSKDFIDYKIASEFMFNELKKSLQSKEKYLEKYRNKMNGGKNAK